MRVLLIMCLCLFQIQINAAVNRTLIDNKIQAFMKHKPVKAIIYGLWVNGEPLTVNALGESMKDVPATKDMHFRIGGVTETLLTTMLMQLVEQKVLSLDDKVSRWYPNLPNANLVTLKMLANCTSGFPDYVYNKKFIDAVVRHPFKQWSDQSILDYAFSEPPIFGPGMDQHYSHTDYVILGNILSQVNNNMPLNELLQSNILNQLGMQHTQFIRTSSMSAPTLHSFSQDRMIYEDASFWSPSWASHSGTMFSTIDDLGQWANAWLTGTLLKEQSTQQLRAPETVGKGKNKKDLYFAMGFGVANHWLIQNPNMGGYSGIFAVLPEKNIVFIAYNTLKEENTSSGNLSMALWKELAADLAPDYPLPEF